VSLILCLGLLLSDCVLILGRRRWPVLSVRVQRSVVRQAGCIACRSMNIMRNRRDTLCAFVRSPSCEPRLWL
jgi:hypothetical protein